MPAARLLVVLALAGLMAVPASAGAATRLKTGEPTRIVRVDYKADPGNVGVSRGWRRPGVVRGWRSVRIPHVMQRRISGRPYPGGTVGWYRIRLSAPAGTEFRADFEQIRRKSSFWLNGRRIGEHRSPYGPKPLSLKGIRRGGNTLIVRVDNRKGRNPIEGWWNWGGIVRPVTVSSVGRLAATSLSVTGNLPCVGCEGELVGQVTFHNRGRSTIADPVMLVGLRDPSGTTQTAPVRTAPLRANRRRLVKFRLPIGSVQTWSPGNPVLYDVTAQTVVAGQPQELARSTTGFRSIGVENGRLMLNGLPLNMRGVSIHEDVPGRGAALRDSDIDGIVRQVKSVGADVVRAHYALNERLLDAFDRNGILVWNQAPVYQRSTQLQSRGRRIQALRDVRGALERGYSHPSVIVNSVANELAPGVNGNPGVARWLDQANRTARSFDPTRPVGIDLRSLPNIGPQKAYSQFDVLGFNQYFGWYGGRPGRSLQFVEDLRGFLQEQRAIYPQQALVVTEFGAEATQSGSVDIKGTYEFQNRYLATNLDIMDSEPYLSGAIYWTLREFAFKPGWLGGSQIGASRRDAIHNKGLISYRTNKAKPAWYLARDRFQAAPLYGPESLAEPEADEDDK